MTSEFLFKNRRAFLRRGTLLGAMSLLPKALWAGELFTTRKNEKYKAGDLKITKEEVATSYNNFYEFSLEKDEVKSKVAAWNLGEWWVEVGGLVEKPKRYNVSELVGMAGGLEERVYRFRCVEAWSMVVPWAGFPLANLIEKLKPSPKAKFIRFQTFGDKNIGPNIARLPNYPWPYTEGLTMTEAKHP